MFYVKIQISAAKRQKICSLMRSLTLARFIRRKWSTDRERGGQKRPRSDERASERHFIDRRDQEIYAYMPAVPPTNICHVIYEPGITLCPIYYILCYVDGLAILSDRTGRRSRRRGACPRCSDHHWPILSLIASLFVELLLRWQSGGTADETFDLFHETLITPFCQVIDFVDWFCNYRRNGRLVAL